MTTVETTRYRHDPEYDRDLVDLDTYRAEFARALIEAVERHRPLRRCAISTRRGSEIGRSPSAWTA